MRGFIRAAIGMTAVGLFAATALPTQAVVAGERELLGIRVWRPAQDVFNRFGAPTRQESALDMSLGAAPAGGGGMSSGNPYSGGSGSSSSSQYSGSGGGGASSAITLKTPEEVLKMMHILSKGVPDKAPVGGSGIPGSTSGGMMGGLLGGSSPYSGGGSSGSSYRPGGSGGYSGSSGYSGSGSSGPSGYPGMSGGIDMSTPPIDMDEGDMRWVYERGANTLVFTFNKDARTVEIATFGLSGAGSSMKGIRLGDTMAKLHLLYGWPTHTLSSDNNSILLLDFRETHHIAFQCTKVRGAYRVTGIIISLVE